MTGELLTDVQFLIVLGAICVWILVSGVHINRLFEEVEKLKELEE